MTNYAKKHPYFLTACIIAGVAIILFIMGFRLQPNLRISKNGSVEITFPLASTTLYIDNKKIDMAGTPNETITRSLSVKTHSIIVSRLGYLPWAKEVTVEAGKKTVLEPIFVAQNTSGQLITKNDPEYTSIRKSVESAQLPTKDNPKKQGAYSVWLEQNTIYTQTEGGTAFAVLTPKDPVRSVDFYKDRSGVLVFASGAGVYVIEAVENAPENKANFFPVYTGAQPIFVKTDNSFLYVLDNENLMMVVL